MSTSCFLRAVSALAAILCFSIPAPAKDAAPTTRPAAGPGGAAVPAGPLDFKVNTIDGLEVNLADYRGKVVLIVNTASRCGFTSQYDGLQKLYAKYREKGFVVLAFPANNFHNQEPDNNEKIKAFVAARFHITFPMMAKISVKGEDQHPLYRYLTAKPTGGKFAGDIEWNFTKLLIGRDGKVIARFPAKVKPEDPKIVAAIEKALDDTVALGR
jgi:glutathione peroxidase